MEGLIKHIEKLLAELPPDVKLIPGTRSLSDVDDLKTYHQTLIATTDMIRDQIEAGKVWRKLKRRDFPKVAFLGSGFHFDGTMD